MAGALPPEPCEALRGLLLPHTSSPDLAWFCLWEGNGAFWSRSHTQTFPGDATQEEIEGLLAEAEAQDAVLAATPRVEAYARSYFLLRGPLSAACSLEPSGWYTSPNLWWPDDRTWIVITEVDGYSTYVGGSRDAIDDLIASSEVESIEVNPRHTYGS
jgi:hypothetical protein